MRIPVCSTDRVFVIVFADLKCKQRQNSFLSAMYRFFSFHEMGSVFGEERARSITRIDQTHSPNSLRQSHKASWRVKSFPRGVFRCFFFCIIGSYLNGFFSQFGFSCIRRPNVNGAPSSYRNRTPHLYEIFLLRFVIWLLRAYKYRQLHP